MAPSIPRASIRLDCPLYACSFDPQDANRLLVAGGGGAGRSGVENTISLLDVSQPDKIAVSSKLELSRDEDNPTTLVVGPRRGKVTQAIVGVNSSLENITKGKNEHLRVFGIDQPSKANAVMGPRIAELSRTSLFASKDESTYQRLLRLAPAFEGSPCQLGAVATSLAKDPEIIVFETPATANAAPKPRGKVELVREAMDLDIIQTGSDQWQLAYCDEHEMYLMDIGKKSSAPEIVYTIPAANDTIPVRPTFRSIRYLTPNFILATLNVPQAGGVILNGYRLPQPGKGKNDGKAHLALSRKMPRAMPRALSLAVQNLSPVSTPGARQGDTQFVAAVAGVDSSISLYAIEHKSVADIELITAFPVKTLKEVHEGAITDLAFSDFLPPKTATMRHMHVKLASVGAMDNRCVVHNLPLEKLLDRAATVRKGGPPIKSRYVLALKPPGPSFTTVVVAIAVFVTFVGLLAQFFLEIRDISQPVIGAHRYAPVSWQRTPRVPVSAGLLTEAIAGVTGAGGKSVVLDAEDGVKVDAHDAEQHGAAKPWDELAAHQRDAWKAKLKEAGHWGEDMGETILQSLFFGEIAGLMENVVRG